MFQFGGPPALVWFTDAVGQGVGMLTGMRRPAPACRSEASFSKIDDSRSQRTSRAAFRKRLSGLCEAHWKEGILQAVDVGGAALSATSNLLSPTVGAKPIPLLLLLATHPPLIQAYCAPGTPAVPFGVQGPGGCDHNAVERCANCATSVPYAISGVNTIR